jgi:hypothetical protein
VSDDELLSRWLDGDLSPAQAEDLQRRLGSEPALAARLEALQGWVGELGNLREIPAPPALDARVLGRAPEAVGRSRALPWGAAAVLAAAAAAVMVLIPSPLELQVLGAEVHVAGDGTIAVDGVRVEVDGAVRVLRSEPPVAGEVEVRVEEGSAVVRPEGAGVVYLAAGERWGEERAAGDAPVTPIVSTGSTSSEVARLQQEVEALRKALEQSRVVGVVAQGQLAATQGDPVPWPAQVLPGLEPDLLHAAVLDVLDGVDRVVLQDFDCSEYPCLTLLRVQAAEEVVSELVAPVIDEVTQGVPGATVSVWSHHFRGPGGGVSLVGFAVAPGKDLHRDGEVGVRLAFRADTLATDHARELVGM